MKAKRLDESSLATLQLPSMPLATTTTTTLQQQQQQQEQQEKDFMVSLDVKMEASSPSSSSLTTTTTTTTDMQVDDELLKLASSDEHQRSGKIRASGAPSSPCCSPRSHLKMKRVSSTRLVRAPDRRGSTKTSSLITPPLKKSSAARRLFGAPSAEELEEFFAAAEDKLELRSFMERYNFDVVHDVPLPGRFEWVKVQE